MRYIEGAFGFPEHGKRGVFKMFDLASFLAYWKDHKTDASRIFATLQPVAFVAVLDENLPSNEEMDHLTNWREHRVAYSPKHSREWTTWSGMSGKPFDGNVKFAEWLEENLPDVAEPGGNTLMDIATTFRVDEQIAFDSAIRLNNGQTSVKFHKDVNGVAGQTGEIKVPELIRLRIPVWEGPKATLYDVDARFKYRLSGPQLKIWFELVRSHKVVEKAFLDILAEIEKETGRAPLFGSADAG